MRMPTGMHPDMTMRDWCDSAKLAFTKASDAVDRLMQCDTPVNSEDVLSATSRLIETAENVGLSTQERAADKLDALYEHTHNFWAAFGAVQLASRHIESETVVTKCMLVISAALFDARDAGKVDDEYLWTKTLAQLTQEHA